MSHIPGIVLLLCMFSVFLIPFIRFTPKPPPLPPASPDLRSLEEKVEEYVRINRAATQLERQRRKSARLQAHRDWGRAFGDTTPPPQT
jgi:hypothetical protein